MTNPEPNHPAQNEPESLVGFPLHLLEGGSSHSAMLDALPDPVFLCTPDGDIVYWNRSAREVSGYSNDELADLNVTELVPRQSQPVLQNKLNEVVETGSTRVEMPVRTGSGQTVPFEVTGSLVSREGATFICCIARDISERKAQEEQLRRRKEQLRLLVDEVEEYAIFMLDPEGHVTTWNAGAEKLKGYAREEIIGEHFSTFYPEEEAEAGKPRRALEVAARKGQWTDEDWRVRKDGSRFWGQVTVTALRDDEGTLQGFAKVTRDMTDRRKREKALEESEQRHRRIFEESRDAIILTTPEGEILDVNSAAEELFGYSRETFLRMDASELYAHPQERKHRIVPELLAADSSRTLEARMAHKEGHTFLASASVTVHRNEDGDPELIQALVRDITEYRQLQRDVLRAQEEERRRLGQDLHDGVASQLTGIRLTLSTATQLLDEDHPAYRRIERAQEIVHECGQDVRRLSRGLSPVPLSEVSLSTALQRLSENTDTCHFERGEDIPALSEKQKTQLYWIAQEAVTNARKYAEADEIVIRLSSTDEEGVLVVEDDGKGFDPSALDDSGLGLRTMRYRAEVLGGSLTLDSEPGKGTRIECRMHSPPE